MRQYNFAVSDEFGGDEQRKADYDAMIKLLDEWEHSNPKSNDYFRDWLQLAHPDQIEMLDRFQARVRANREAEEAAANKSAS